MIMIYCEDEFGPIFYKKNFDCKNDINYIHDHTMHHNEVEILEHHIVESNELRRYVNVYSTYFQTLQVIMIKFKRRTTLR